MLGAPVVVLDGGAELEVLAGGAVVADGVVLAGVVVVVVVEAMGWFVTVMRMRLIVTLATGAPSVGLATGLIAIASIFCATSSPEVTVPNRA